MFGMPALISGSHRGDGRIGGISADISGWDSGQIEHGG